MSMRLLDKLTHFLVSIRVSILFIFASLLITITLLIILVTKISYTKSIKYVAFDLMRYASTSVINELNTHIKPAAVDSAVTAKLIEQRILEEGTFQLEPLTVELVKTLPVVVGAYWSNQSGDFIHSKQENDGSITTELYIRSTQPATKTVIYRDSADNIIKKTTSTTLDYDPRERPWYIQVQKAQKTIWTDIYFFKPTPDIGISAISPVFKDGAFYGAFGVDINLNDLSQFIKSQKISANGISFIITKQGKLIAYPDKKPFTHLTVRSGEFITVDDHSFPLINSTLAKYNQSGQEKMTFSYDFEGDTFMITYQAVDFLAPYGWLVGVIVPQSDFTSDLTKMNLITLSISFVILILGVLLVSGLTTYIVRPIKALVAETDNIKKFNLDGEVPIQSNIKEIVYLRDAIHAMKLGLKLFQRYIPKVLVQQLIESGENIRIGGVRKELAIFFSDIENFTTITEQTDPNVLIKQMGEYFEALTQIIISEKGTIDKYIGDAIMAFWGAPLPDPDSCQNAARAALRCQLKLDELNSNWVKQGNTPFVTRIGIHFGEAIIGNLGSSERLNYTAVGDSINTASRLEGINKNYKTKIIVSEAVYEQIKDTFTLRKLDSVVLKGQTKSITIYELIES